MEDSRRYRSLGRREEENEEEDDSGSSEGGSEDIPSRPQRPPARSRGLLIAGGIVALILFTLGGLALISYYSNQHSSSTSESSTTSRASSAATASSASSTTSPSLVTSTDASEGTSEVVASSKTSLTPGDDVTSSTTASASSSASATSSTAASDLSLLTTLGVTEFLGENSGIGSWFRTDSSTDSTNGNSWCGCPYNDSVPGFAPSVGTMLGNFNDVYEDAGKAYCGLEARFTAPNGNTELLVIGDGFDDKWVLSPGSVDIIWGSFGKLFGSETTDKNDVIKDLKWEFTGVQRKGYTFEVCR